MFFLRLLFRVVLFFASAGWKSGRFITGRVISVQIRIVVIPVIGLLSPLPCLRSPARHRLSNVRSPSRSILSFTVRGRSRTDQCSTGSKNTPTGRTSDSPPGGINLQTEFRRTFCTFDNRTLVHSFPLFSGERPLINSEHAETSANRRQNTE